MKLDVSDVPGPAAQAEAAIDRLDQKVNSIGSQRQTINIDLDGVTKAKAELDLLEKKLRDLKGTKINVGVTGVSTPAKSTSGGGGGGGGNDDDGTVFGLRGTGPIPRALGSLFNVSPEFALGIAAAIVAGSPLIAAALNAALMVGAGGGGLALGIVGQIENPMVKAAATRFAKNLKDNLAFATQSFAEPLSRSLDMLGVGISNVLNKIDFTSLSKQLEPLAAGIAGAFENMNIGDLLKSAEPIIHEFAALLPGVGKAVGNFFHEIESSQGTMEGLRVIILLLVSALSVLGTVLGGLGNAFNGMVIGARMVFNVIREVFTVVSQLFDLLATATKGFYIEPVFEGLSKFAGAAANGVAHIVDLIKWIRGGGKEAEELDRKFASLTDQILALNDATGGLSGSTLAMVDSIEQTKEAITPLLKGLQDLQEAATGNQMVFRTLSAVLGHEVGDAVAFTDISFDSVTKTLENKVFNALMGAKTAAVQFQLSLLDLDDAIAKNGKSLTDGSRGALENQLMLLRLVEANQQVYQANMDTGKGVDYATTKFEEQQKEIEDHAVKLGLDRGEVHNLIGELGKVPGETKNQMIMSGLASAINNLAEMLRQLVAIEGAHYGSLVFTTTYRMIGQPPRSPGSSRAGESGFSMLDIMSHGGVTRAASGILAPQNPGTVVLAGEPETGGEIFMPLMGISRQRAMGLAQIAGNAYGFTVVPHGQFVQSQPQVTTYTVNLTVNAGMGTDGYTVGKQVIGVIQDYERANGAAWRT